MTSYAASVSSIFILISALIKGTLHIRVTTPESVAIPLGGRGSIPCNVDIPSFQAIYWSRQYSKDSVEGVVSRIDGRLSGSGLESGDFNISEDNSLEINYMHLDYEATYVCIVLDYSYVDDRSPTDVIATVKPETPPEVTWACDDRCRSELGPDSILNLTCTSDEAKPAVTLTWLTDKGTPIEAETSDIRKGSILRGTFVTTSTIRYSVKRNITLTCQAENEVIGRRKAEQGTDVKLYETVTPSAPPDITSSCVDYCQSGLLIGTQLNLTCTSGEAKPPVKLKWLNSHGMPIEPLYSDVKMGSLTGAFVTTSTIQLNFTVNTSLICRAETVEGTRVGPLMTRIELNEDGIGAVAHQENLSAVTGSDPEDEDGTDIVTILLVAVSVAVGVVIILVIIVAVLYKKNKEYIDAISYSYCLSRDGYILFARSQFSQQQNQNVKL